MKYLLFLILGPLSINAIFGQNTTETRLKVYVFLSDECPMCQGYAPVLNQLATDYGKKGVELITAFKTEYNIVFKTIKDSTFTLTNFFKASTTPQVFMSDTEGSLLYNGQIDDTYFRAGKRRGTTSAFYLKSAIEAALANQKPDISQTKAIGCVIVRD
jgi:thiol-disulfide isomerase/thioredoxin